MNKFIEILLGLILLAVPILAAIFNWIPGLGKATLVFIGGAVVVILVLFGLLFLILGISDLNK
ncbi:MAG: hypothetical protein NTX24_03550 [Candidatus Pacearchaeota archaeon]|nr:hypothetical protein [Candidatus Pacearchaeota archaeon]